MEGPRMDMWGYPVFYLKKGTITQEQPTMDGPPDCGTGGMLTNPHLYKFSL
jgi:hypothetical protein